MFEDTFTHSTTDHREDGIVTHFIAGRYSFWFGSFDNGDVYMCAEQEIMDPFNVGPNILLAEEEQTYA